MVKTKCDWCGVDLDVPKEIFEEGIPAICGRGAPICYKDWSDED